MSSENIENRHSNKPPDNKLPYNKPLDSGTAGRTFRWCPETKTVQAVDPSSENPNLMTIGPEDTKYFTDGRI